MLTIRHCHTPPEPEIPRGNPGSAFDLQARSGIVSDDDSDASDDSDDVSLFVRGLIRAMWISSVIEGLGWGERGKGGG